MGIKVHVDIAKLEQKLNDTQLRRGRLAMANDAHQAMEKYVPKKEGTLRETSKVATDGSSVYYVQPYARAQFYDLPYAGLYQCYGHAHASVQPPVRTGGGGGQRAGVQRVWHPHAAGHHSAYFEAAG